MAGVQQGAALAPLVLLLLLLIVSPRAVLGDLRFFDIGKLIKGQGFSAQLREQVRPDRF